MALLLLEFAPSLGLVDTWERCLLGGRKKTSPYHPPDTRVAGCSLALPVGHSHLGDGCGLLVAG